MLDQSSPAPRTDARKAEKTYDLVVIGAGIAGLNALYAAMEYLPKGADVLMIDQKSAAGGMWNTAYDYVRLHQPHPMFTVGDMTWDWRKPREYLAARNEVQAHLASALGVVGRSVALDSAFGQTVATCREIETSAGPRAEVVYHPNEDPARPRIVQARLAVHASGLNYQLADPLRLSSDQVVSIQPGDLTRVLKAHPDAPLFVVGGGKTGMDSILAALSQSPARQVSLINGRGTNFFNRTRNIPTGLKRWTSGVLVSRLFHDLATRFDGDNEDALIAHVRAHHSTDPSSENGVFLYGLQSEDEHARIQSGLHAVFGGYLADVVDTETGPEMRLKDGTAHAVAPGSVFVNCTGSFFRSEALVDHRPMLTPGNTVLSINPRETMHFLTSVTGFFAVHLLYRDKLRGQGIYRLDHEALFRQNRNAWVGAAAAQAYLNQTIAVQQLPIMLLDRCGLDLDRWYPFPRRMAALLRMKMNATADKAHCTRVLDRVAARFDVLCAPLD